jgi:DNA-binding response OmpR family regulator
MNSILIVDDDKNQRLVLSDVLKSEKFAVDEASSGEEALEKARTYDFDVMLLDEVMPYMSGMDVLGEIRKLKPGISVIIVTGFATVDNAVEAMKRGASDYISKPIDIDELVVSIRRALEEAKFDAGTHNPDLDFVLSSLSNPIRRNIIKMLCQNKRMHLMKMTRLLEIEDHTKVLFHMKMLKEAGLVEKDKQKSYYLTYEGRKSFNCLRILENYFLP